MGLYEVHLSTMWCTMLLNKGDDETSERMITSELGAAQSRAYNSMVATAAADAKIIATEAEMVAAGDWTREV